MPGSDRGLGDTRPRTKVVIAVTAFVLLAVVGGAWEELQVYVGDPIVALIVVLIMTVLLFPLAYGRR